MKFVFPVMWIGGFATGTFRMFVFPASWSDKSGNPVDDGMKWIFLGITLVGSAFIYWSCARLKSVEMDDRSLIISNYSSTIVVPLTEVADVSENRWINIHPVTIEFRSETAFGQRIVFMPKARFFSFGWSSHPVVEEIRSAVARAQFGTSSPAAQPTASWWPGGQ
jgi:hypothetical protein